MFQKLEFSTVVCGCGGSISGKKLICMGTGRLLFNCPKCRKQSVLNQKTIENHFNTIPPDTNGRWNISVPTTDSQFSRENGRARSETRPSIRQTSREPLEGSANPSLEAVKEMAGSHEEKASPFLRDKGQAASGEPVNLLVEDAKKRADDHGENGSSGNPLIDDAHQRASAETARQKEEQSSRAEMVMTGKLSMTLADNRASRQ